MSENNSTNQQKRFCQHCGAEVSIDTYFCQNCGTAVKFACDEPSGTSTPPMQPMYPVQPASAEEQDAKDNKAMAILSYFGILFLIPLFAAKESPFARYHCNNGLVLFIANIAVSILSSLTSAIINPISLLLAGLITLAIFVVSVFLIVVAIMGLVAAIKGEKKELPIIGKIKILK